MKTLGVDIGGTKCAVVIGEVEEDRVTVLDKLRMDTLSPLGCEQALTRLGELIERLLARSGQGVSRAGISCGGPLDSRTGHILSPPNLPGWDNVPITRWIEEKFGIPARLENDANACALAEWCFGAGRGTQNMIFLTFGTGMGAGLILNGQLYRGANGNAGEVGHMRLESYGPVGYGKAGSFEGFCSGGGIAQLAALRVRECLQRGEEVAFCRDGRVEALTAKSLAEAALAGDTLAHDIYAECGRKLGVGLSLLVDVLNPEAIVLGSIFARSQSLLWPAAEEVLRRESLRASLTACRILPAQLGEQISDVAALAVAGLEE